MIVGILFMGVLLIIRIAVLVIYCRRQFSRRGGGGGIAVLPNRVADHHPPLTGDNHAVNGRLNKPKEENQKLERQLKMLNKPAIKSIYKEDGDIFDCVDIYKQPSLDHPLLKNHSIQMEPNSYPISTINKSSSTDKFQNIDIEIEGCPKGTIIIRRIRKEELVASQSLTNSFSKSLQTDSNLKLHWAWIQTNINTTRDYYGAKATINVHPLLTGDSQSRLFIYWTADGYKSKGCYNLICPGFVQVSKSISIGTSLPVSTYGGPQKEIILSIFQITQRSDIGQRSSLIGCLKKLKVLYGGE
ncbi:hypothetical protein QJS10_CPB13g00153 [Acorus calamus]|uniref:Neprosin PEP catalytic domain-containing protein n=1 Tax=Acorus calamus TaxID=4465 RepID=A0AAV9DHG7_ACOCL|nr:hypothetical protein QJS10_CPB13g00153 [Acorus calamus]